MYTCTDTHVCIHTQLYIYTIPSFAVLAPPKPDSKATPTCACNKSYRTCQWVMSHTLYTTTYIRKYTCIYVNDRTATDWRSCIWCLKLQVSFCKRATNCKAFWRKMIYKDKASCYSTTPCRQQGHFNVRLHRVMLHMSIRHIAHTIHEDLHT